MNDLRERANYDAEHHASDERTQYDLLAARRIDPQDLTIVPLPNPRSPAARELDAETRDLPHYDTRTEDERLVAELVRLVDCIQGLTLRVELLEGVIWQLARAVGVPEAQDTGEVQA